MSRYVLIALLSMTFSARAAPLEMSTQTCQDWLDAGDDERELMIAWLRGYVAGKSTSTLFDMNGARTDAAVMRSFCQGHLTMGLVSAAGQQLKP